mmetsp:Transcript_97756/g.254953  ORF Transcript_97756/g.254953 Transcript_97756/m.254953 type:complete len:254 (-) Transcript_97756:506-1267(-)
MANLLHVEPDLVCPSGDDLQVHHCVGLTGQIKPSDWLVKGQGILDLLHLLVAAASLWRRVVNPKPVIDGMRLVRCLVVVQCDLDTTPAILQRMLPMGVALVRLRRQLHVPVAEAQIVLLGAAFLQAVRAGELPSDIDEAEARLGGDHHPGGLLVQAVATTALCARAVPALAACALDHLRLVLPELASADGALVVVLEGQVLVQLDGRVVAVQQHRRTRFLTQVLQPPLRHLGAVSAGVHARLVDDQDLVSFTQ